jgi:hypothetical protein
MIAIISINKLIFDNKIHQAALKWGRNGFDGGKEALAAYRAFLSARKTTGK